MEFLPDFLKKNPVFAVLSPSNLEQMARVASLRSYINGEKIILYGEVWSYLFMVKNGEIEARRNPSRDASFA